MSAYEPIYSNALSEALRQEGLDSRPEQQRSGGLRWDVQVGVSLALEAKIANQAGAMEAALARLEQGEASAAIAVSYPRLEDPARDLKTLEAAEADGEWRKMDIAGLADLIRTVMGQIGDVDATARVFRQGLEDAASRLTPDAAEPAVKASNIPVLLKGGAKELRQAERNRRLRVALLVASAALFHARLDGVKLRKPRTDARTGKPFEGEWPPRKLQEALKEPDCAGALIEAWELILALDYKPVFRTAVDVLEALPPTPETTDFAGRAARAGLSAARSLAGKRHDLLGRVFHWILDTAPNTGAYYTSSATAALLAGLAIKQEHADKFPHLKIVDPACGTGTLLMAAAQQLGRLNPEAGTELGGKHLIEEVLVGYDIEAAATQMAAVALGLMNPVVTFEKMGISQLTYGTNNYGAISAGSLELFSKAAAANFFVPVSRQVETGEEEVVKAAPHDIVIMNPPYSRDTLRHGHLSEAQRETVKKREETIFKDVATAREGGSGMFLVLAEKLCEAEDGTMATVAPTACLGGGGGSMKKLWGELLKKFHLETVVSSHDPRRPHFSENTDIMESLIIFRRFNEGNRGAPTAFINLESCPSKPSEAMGVAADILSGKTAGLSWPRRRVEAQDWTPIKFVSPYLAEATAEWFVDNELGCVPLGDLAEVGPAGQAIRGVYIGGKIIEADERGRWGIWYNNQDKPSSTGAPPKQAMRSRPDCSLLQHPKNTEGKSNLSDKYWEQRGRLFLPVKFRLGPARTLAVRLDNPALGSQWVPVKKRDGDGKKWEKAVCAYLNSVVGILAQLSVATFNHFGRPGMALEEGQRKIPVPEFSDGQIDALAKTFEKTAKSPMLGFRDAGNDPVRQTLNAKVAKAMGLDEEKVASLCFALAAEPSVAAHGRRDAKAGK